MAAALLLLTFSSSNGFAQSAEVAPPGWPQWLTDAMSQERRMMRSRKVELGDGLITSRLAGKPAGDPQPIEDGWYIPRDIDTGTPLECWVFTTLVDPATLANNIAEQSMLATEQVSGPLSDRSLYHVGAGAVDGVPYVSLEWFYAVGESPNKAVGLAKVRVAIKEEVSFACAHNFLGYRETFALAFNQFVTEAEIEVQQAAPYYEEITLQKIGDQVVGIAHASFTFDDYGDTQITMLESTMVPVDNSTLSTSDTWSSKRSRADGTLINQQTAKVENGALTMLLALDPLDGGAWSVSGTFQGKDISYELTETSEPISDLGQMLAVQALLADAKTHTATLPVWLPEADPTQFIDAEVALDSTSREAGVARLTMGPLAIAAQFDPTGSLVHAGIQSGAAHITMERIWVRGELP